MKELDYITKQFIMQIITDGTFDDVEKNYIKSKLLERKFKIEEEIKKYKKTSLLNGVDDLLILKQMIK